MTLTPATLVRHELIGLEVTVVDASNPDLIGIAGRVVDETTRTLLVEDDRTRRVPKANATFEFVLPDGAYAVVEGDRLVARPARRTESTGGSIWRSA